MFGNEGKILKEFHINTISGIKAKTVYFEIVYPHSYRIKEVFSGIVVFQVQLYEVIVSVPSLITKRVAKGTPLAKIKSMEPA
jgi:hypothetical protein